MKNLSQSPPEQNNSVSPKLAKEKLWKKGVLYWKLDSNQQSMRDFVQKSNTNITVLVCSRQLGKSFALSCFAIEECLKKPNTKVLIVAPEVKMIKNILYPRIREILQDCPQELLPRYKTHDHKYEFPNGSEIQLAGSDSGNAESIRGTTAHLCIIDEAGFCDNLSYLIKDILIPTITTTAGRIILSSTPPKTNDHEFKRFWEKAEMDGNLFKRTIYDNPRLTPERIEALAELMGGKETISWRREYLCEAIIDDDDAVVPEFTEYRSRECIKPWPRPTHYDAYTAMDIGFNDFTVVLFAYYDYKNAKLIIEDEHVINGRKLLSEEFARDVLQKEKSLWVNPLSGESKAPFQRVSDNNNLIFLNDLAKYKLHFLTIDKRESDAALNYMRQLIKNDKIVINPRCKVLISHLKNAIWNSSRTSYRRSSDNGHYDAVDSLKYLVRAVNFNKDPYPVGYQFDKYEDVFFNEKALNSNELEAKLKDMFKVKRIKPKSGF